MPRVATAAATVPEPCQIAGTPLRPFCLGHHLLFKRMEFPFAGNATAAATLEDIILGIAICAASYEDTLEAFLCGDWENIVRRWQKRVAGPIWKRRRIDWEDSTALFRAYLADGYQRPPVFQHIPKGGTVTISAPWEELLKCRLVSAGFPETEVLNGYLPCRWYDYFTVMELEQAKTCSDSKNWKKVFFTEADAEEIGAAQSAQPEGDNHG
jgi:hypothetical protein